MGKIDRVGVYRWPIFCSLALFVLFNFIQLNMMNVLSVYIVHMFNISALRLGFIGSAYFYTNLIFIFFSGLLLDFFSPKKLVLSAIGISLFGLVFFTVAPSELSLIAWRLVAGITCSFSITGSFKIIARFFSENERGLIIGLIGMIATCAGIISQLPLSYALQNFGIKESFFIIIGIGSASLLMVYIFVPSHFIKPAHHFFEMFRTSNKVFLNFKNWCAALFECLVNLPLFVLGALWGSMYLIKMYHMDGNSAALIISMLFLGHMIGAPCFGWLTDRMNSRKILLLFGSGVAILSVVLINALSFYSTTVLLLLFLLLGISTGTQIVTDAFVVGNNKDGVARAISLLSLVSVSGGVVFQPLFGFIVQNGRTVAAGYQHAMYVLIVTSCVAFILGLFIPNKEPLMRKGVRHGAIENV